jgi:hypothetical protein
MVNLSLYENEFQRASKFICRLRITKFMQMFVITKDSNSKISKAKRFYKNKKNQNRFGEKFKRKQIMVFF